MDYFKKSISLHKKHQGKIGIELKVSVKNKEDLATIYTPGIAGVSKEIYKDKSKAYDLTMKGNSVAIVSDGSAVLGLGNIGAEAAIPVMEGKSVIFKKFVNIDAFPICVNTQDTEEIINIVKNISPNFAAINLEDISAPRCFKIENNLQNIEIPVMHDDQHGTAIVVFSALINSLKIVKKDLSKIKITISGAGAAGFAIWKLLKTAGAKNIIVCDSKGIICDKRSDIKSILHKKEIAKSTNKNIKNGLLPDALKNSDVFIGVSAPNTLKKEWIKLMNKKPIVFAMANPDPEILPSEAKKAGAYIVATGRSDFSNQINNASAYPGIFRGAIDARAKKITGKMKLSASYTLANLVKNLNKNNIMPSILDTKTHIAVANAVKKAYKA